MVICSNRILWQRIHHVLRLQLHPRNNIKGSVDFNCKKNRAGSKTHCKGMLNFPKEKETQGLFMLTLCFVLLCCKPNPRHWHLSMGGTGVDCRFCHKSTPTHKINSRRGYVSPTGWNCNEWAHPSSKAGVWLCEGSNGATSSMLARARPGPSVLVCMQGTFWAWHGGCYHDHA